MFRLKGATHSPGGALPWISAAQRFLSRACESAISRLEARSGREYMPNPAPMKSIIASSRTPPSRRPGRYRSAGGGPRREVRNPKLGKIALRGELNFTSKYTGERYE